MFMDWEISILSDQYTDSMKSQPNPRRLYGYILTELILKFTWQGKGVTMQGEGLTTKGQHRGILWGDGAVLYHAVVIET